jgi:hypothetical protein
VPFLPFSKAEAAALAHKFLLNLGDNMAKSNIIASAEYQGKIRLSIEDDSRLCTHLAETGYDIKFGARSIEQEVVKKVQVDMVGQYWKLRTGTSPPCSGDRGEKERARDVTFKVKCCRTDGYEKVTVSLE